ARAAPGCPEIDEDGLAHRFADHVVGKIRRGRFLDQFTATSLLRGGGVIAKADLGRVAGATGAIGIAVARHRSFNSVSISWATRSGLVLEQFMAEWEPFFTARDQEY